MVMKGPKEVQGKIRRQKVSGVPTPGVRTERNTGRTFFVREEGSGGLGTLAERDKKRGKIVIAPEKKKRQR